MDIGHQIKKLRSMKGWSQRELSKHAGIPNSTVSMIEQNRVNPTLDTLDKLLSALGLTSAQFFNQPVLTNPAEANNVQHFTQTALQDAELPTAGNGALAFLTPSEDDPQLQQTANDTWLLATSNSFGIATLQHTYTLSPGEALWLGRGEIFALLWVRGVITDASEHKLLMIGGEPSKHTKDSPQISFPLRS
ncbi:MAG: helix-turn-helix domain-containing protein [Cellvibrionaceae bacterium]